MPNPVRVLFAGESWMTRSVHTKGFDSFDMSSYHEGGTEMIAALRGGGIELTYQPSHIAMESFPFSRKEIDSFDVVILSEARRFAMRIRLCSRRIPLPSEP